MKKIKYTAMAVNKLTKELLRRPGTFDSLKEACGVGCPAAGQAYDVHVHEIAADGSINRSWKITQEF